MAAGCRAPALPRPEQVLDEITPEPAFMDELRDLPDPGAMIVQENR